MRTSGSVETYARVLFDLASMSDTVDTADVGLKSAAGSIAGHADLRDTLNDASIPGEKKREIVRAIFGESVTPEVVAIVSLVVDKGDSELLGSISDRFGQIAEAERNIVVAEVTTAIELTDDVRGSLVKKLTTSLGRPVSLREHVDASILGGIVIEVAGRLLDGSISSQLDSVRLALSTLKTGGEV